MCLLLRSDLHLASLPSGSWSLIADYCIQPTRGRVPVFWTLDDWPQICASRQSCLQIIPLTLCLIRALTCSVNCGTLYRQVPFQSTEFITGKLQISCTNISTMISGNRMLNFELNDKGYEYLSTCNFLVYLFFNKWSKFPQKTFFTLSWWGVCRILMEKLNKYILE